MKTPPFAHRFRLPLMSAAFALFATLALSACGGGSGSSAPPPVQTNPPVTPPVVEPPVVSPPVVVEPPVVTNPPVTPVDPPIIIKPPENKPGGSPLNPVAAVIGDDNVAPIYVDAGPANGNGNTPNAIFVDVKICAPGNTNNCAVIDHVLVDTGSVGLRVFAADMPSQLLGSLASATSGGEPLGQCISFISGTTWGSVRKADIRMGGTNQGGKLATNMAIQIIADPGAKFASIPASCQTQGTMLKTAADVGAKGIIGVGLFAQDCGSACTVFAAPVYYACSSVPCRQIPVPLADQVGNPLTGFGADNNGNIIILPPLSNHVAERAEGMLIFGLGTRSNNALPAGSSVLGATNLGYFSSDFNGRTLSNSFIDSGSSINFFPAGGNFISCSGAISSFFCPGGTLSLTASNTGRAGTVSSVSILTVDASAAFTAHPTAHAFEGLAGAVGAPYLTLNMGASFFFGRSVGMLIDGRSAVGVSTTGPAFTHTP
ncbi:DUF3443 family protein [Janthinobacterium sp. SUN100]|uniref:DUF3443 family protein n=1 Tax=Janthinobacterium sp. SUN100 TaxID=3004101 RepID=UPI0025B2310A|nr:DUF3443 family protein [Janthinobacterium sp. SUN100]MDN2704335.1 DUF3443 family protein [Janthinobacterium sp. SUN100]